MATIRHINKKEYAAKALDLMNGRREVYVNYALGLLQQSLSPGQAGEKLEEKVKREMEHLYNTYGYCRRICRRSSKREVPSNLLDIEKVLPNYKEVIGNMMVDAEKLRIIVEIETITKKAKENNHEV